MSSLSSGTGRIEPPKIEFECNCGKKYRVSATKAGKSVRCKRCKIKITVPGSMRISMRTRQAILEELGIDPEQSAKAYEDKGYRCSVCDKAIRDVQLKTAYGSDGLICPTCRPAKAPKEKSKEEKRKEAKLEDWTSSTTTPEAAKRKALGFGALFFVGTAGLLNTIGMLAGSPGIGVSVFTALVVAGVGARSIYKAELSC